MIVRKLVDKRFLYSSLATDVAGIVLVSILYEMALAQTSLTTAATIANVAIGSFAVTSVVSIMLMIIGIFLRRPITYRQLGIIGVSSFALGAFALYGAFVSVAGYGADKATCGGFPPGYWTGVNATINPCSIFVSVHEEWVSTIYILILISSVVIFSACVFMRLRIAQREENRAT